MQNCQVIKRCFDQSSNIGLVVGFWISLFGLLGCSQTHHPPPPSPLPVSVQVIEPVPDGGGQVLSGVIRPWIEEDIAAEVGGQLTFVARPGDHLDGRWEDNGHIVVDGELVATIEPWTYQAAVESAKANVLQAKAQFEKVAPAQVAEAQANVVLESELFRRVKEAHDQGAATRSELLEAQSKLDSASARLALRQAGLEVDAAGLKTAMANLTVAELDLKRAQIYAPFTGVVSQSYRSAGGYIQPGAALVHLVMMDPMLVDVVVSRQTASSTLIDDIWEIKIPGWPTSLKAMVYAKSVSADPTTLTFKVTLIVRNPIVTPDQDEGVQLIGHVISAEANKVGSKGNILLPDRRSILQDETGRYVWRLIEEGNPNTDVNQRRVYRVEKVPVELGDVRRNFLGLAVGRDLVDLGTLKVGDLVAMDPPDNLADGDRVSVSHIDWGLQPGQVVRVIRPSLKPINQVTALVPVGSIVRDAEGQTSIFIAQDSKAIQVLVEVGQVFGDQQQVWAVSNHSVHDADLTSFEDGHVQSDDNRTGDFLIGKDLIIRGAHLLRDGQAVRVVKTANQGGQL